MHSKASLFNRFTRPNLLLLFGFLLALPLHAQQYLGTLSGTVTDSSGAKITGAQITATDVTTHFATTAKTNGAGQYTIPFLTPDTYTIDIAATSFGPETRTGVVLTAGGSVQTDFTLNPGSQATQVVVTADSALLDTASANLSTTLDTAQVVDTPNIGRNPFVLSTLAANVTSGGYMQSKASGFTNPFSGTAVQILASGSSGHNRLTLDGIPDDPAERLSGAGYTGFVPSPEAVQEVKLQTAEFDAQYGHGNGTVTNTVLRSGSNKYHGAAYYVFRNTYMDANTHERVPHQNVTGSSRTPRVNDQWSQPGFVLDGPLSIPHLYNAKDKTFFMVAYERIQLHQPLPYTGLVPTVSGGLTGTGEANGDFSSLCSSFDANGVCNPGAGIQIYDPTSVLSGNGNRTPFAYNEIPSGKISAAGKALISYFPAPNSTLSPVINYISSDTSEPNKYFSFATRVDHQFSARQHVSFTFFKAILNQLEPNEGFAKNIGPSTGTNGGDGYTVYRNNEGGSVDDAIVVKPNLVVDARFGLIYHPFGLVYPGNVFDLSTVGINGGNLPYQSFPNTTASDSFAGLAGGADGQISEFTLGSTSLLVSQTIRHHSLKYGYDGNLSRYNVQNPQSGLGNFAFDRTFTQENSSGQTGTNCPAPSCIVGGDPSSGNPIASLLLGYPTSGSYGNQVAYALQQKYLAFYVQDDWRVSSRLTLNLGLRWDYESPFTDRYNRLNAAFCTTCVSPLQSEVTALTLNGGLTFVATPAHPSRFAVPQEFKNFQPRFGAAYQLNPKMVLRGGLGLIYFNTLESPLAQGFSNSTAYVATTNSVYPINSIADPYPNGVQLPSGSALGLSTQLGQGLSYPDPNHVQPRMFQWSTSLQVQLLNSLVLQVAYSGNKVTDLEINKNIDDLPATYMGTSSSPLTAAQISALTASVANPLAGLLPGSSLNGAKVQQYLLDVPYPQFTGVTDDYKSAGSVLYNSLAVTVTKQLSNRLEMQGNFTWSKTMDQNVYLNPQATSPFRYQDPNPNLIANVFGTYHFWEFSNKPAYVRLPIGGWSLNGVLRAYNGSLISNPGSTGGSQYGTSTTYTQLTNPKLAHSSYAQYFNSCFENSNGVLQSSCNATNGSVPAFRANPEFTLNNLGPYMGIRQLVHPLVDLSLFKQFQIHHGYNFEIRGEFFNVLNTPNFGGPGTSPGTSAYGVVTLTQQNDPRLIQITARVNF